MWNQQAEAMPIDERAELQAARLNELLRRLREHSPFYRRRLGEAGVDTDAPVTLEDLPEFPFTAKADLWEHYPWGMLAVPREEVVRVHGSSGTSGRPTLVAYSRADLALWAEVCARSLGCAGAGPGTVVHNGYGYGYGLFTGGLGMHAGAELMGGGGYAGGWRSSTSPACGQNRLRGHVRPLSPDAEVAIGAQQHPCPIGGLRSSEVVSCGAWSSPRRFGRVHGPNVAPLP